MLISHDWLRAFVDHGLPAEGIRDLLSAHVATVDRMEPLRQDLSEVVVARVLEAGRHPNADTLWVTKVDDGSGTVLDVVCGAPNVTVGALYPFARAGTTLPGGVKLEKRKIRGEISNGMLCSARELQLGEDQAGIMELEVDVAPGTPLLDAISVGDVRFDVDVLPNRPDLLSHRGMARDVAALTSKPLRLPEELHHGEGRVPVPVHGDREAASGGVTVRIDDAEGCPRYMGVAIRGVRVGASPPWLARRLESIGLRPINNVVDATNYFLWGFGQPMHAFDLSKLAGSTIVVRRARRGEKLVTLDGVERTLDDRMTVIADAQRATAIAGVMGGRESEVTDATTDLFLEVAYFTPRNVRAARRALGLSTDASYRFERGVDPVATAELLAGAVELLLDVAGGRVDSAPVDVGAPPSDDREVTLRPARVTRLLGDNVAAEEIARLLRSVGFVVSPDGGGAMVVRSPSWRNDVSREHDLVEEIARLRGYDVLPDDVQPFRPSTVPDHPLHLLGRQVRDALVGDGLYEVRPMPFVRGVDDRHVRVQNPLADDEPHLRSSLLETLARRAEYNLSRMQGNVRIFEIGSVFERRGAGLPHEELRVGALVMGLRRPAHFTEPHPPQIDVWDARGLGERIGRLVSPDGRVTVQAGSGDVLWTIASGDGRALGRVQRISLDAPPWAAPVFGVEVLLGVMPNDFVASPGRHARRAGAERPSRGGAVPYRPLPTTPSTKFDLALLVPMEMRAEQVERVLRTSGGELLEHVALFDEYRGEGLPAGYRSIAWTLTFRDPSRTLRDKEIEGRRQKILKSLENELGVRPRTERSA